MSNPRRLSLALAGAVLAAVLAFSIHRYERSASAKSARELAAIRSELEELTGKVEGERRRSEQQLLVNRLRDASRSEARLAPPSSSSQESGERPRETGPSSPTSHDAELSAAEVVAHVDSAYESELIDPAWSRQAVTSLRNHVASLLPEHASLKESDCRGTLCRMRLSFPDHAAYAKFADATFHDPNRPLPENSASLYSVEETKGDEVTVIAYTARAGANIPTLDAQTAPANQ